MSSEARYPASAVWAPLLDSPKTCRARRKAAEQAAAPVTNARAGKAAETHKLLSHRSIFLF